MTSKKLTLVVFIIYIIYIIIYYILYYYSYILFSYLFIYLFIPPQKTVRVKGRMSLRNGMWNDVRNGIIMQNTSCGMT